ncbi:phytoene desaturase family protein [Microbacterium sp. No. 7]|uniref:phytoene desaturase family protein n=1 Tax=Microbacterium sp. No. 7 TaxID=1714373 RepID=UPI0006D28F32|nr:phytoene desaturase family protein [Microbacterium sp. No. 7]ALJ18446.1 phytoene dehydrogenase [Microbacterium sp. No. 7]
MTRTIVIGGGIAGLATAALLAREGHAVRLLERGRRVGGRAGIVERGGFRFDTGPSWYLMPEVFEHFFALLGTTAGEQLDLRTLDPGYRVYSEPAGAAPARVTDIPNGRERVMSRFETIEPGSAATLEKYLSSAEQASRLAGRYFLYNPFTRLRSLATADVVRAAPKLASLLGTDLERFVARRFADPVLRQVLGYPAVFLGTDPRRAPALYHLMSALDLGDGVLYPMGGFWSIVQCLEQLATRAGVEIVLDSDVTRILTRRERGDLVVNGVRVRDDRGAERVEHADVVVSAADLHHTETQLLPPEAQSHPASWWQKAESGPGAIIALLGVRGALPRLEHHSLFFTRDWAANFDAIFGEAPHVPEPASLYVCRPSATDPAVAPPDHENLFILIPVPADTGLGAGGIEGNGAPAIERAVDAAIDQISRWAGIPDLRDRIVVRETLGPADFARDYHSWHGGMLGPAHTLRQSALFRPQNQSRRVRNLYYAGATTAPGVGVPMCLISAELVLKRLRRDHSPGPTAPRIGSEAAAR